MPINQRHDRSSAISPLLLLSTLLLLLLLLQPTHPHQKKTHPRPASIQKISRRVTSRHPSRPPVPYTSHPFDAPSSSSRNLNTHHPPSLYQPLRITFDYSNLPLNPSPSDQIRINALKNIIIPGMASHWTNALRVIPTTDGISTVVSTSDENDDGGTTCFGLINVPRKTFREADLVVFVAGMEEIGGDPFCVKGSGTLAAAAVCDVDQFDRPVIGLMNFCLDEIQLDSTGTTIPSPEIQNSISIAMHEIAHILGVNSEQLKFFRHPLTGEPLTPRPFKEERFVCLNGVEYSDIIVPGCQTLDEGRNSRGERYFEVVTPTVRQVVQNQFNCQELRGGRLENQPTNYLDCFGSHWDERLFYTETLSAFYSPEANYFSPLTLALLEDSGWYRANYSTSVLSPFGHGAGCNFVSEDCINDEGNVPDYGKGFFCNEIMDEVTEMVDSSSVGDGGSSRSVVKFDYECDPSHTHKAVCDLAARGGDRLPKEGKYFEDGSVGVILFERADYCPIALFETINCQDPENQNHRVMGGEVFGPGSKCFDSSSPDSKMRSLCLFAKCDPVKGVLEVHINREVYICEEDFQKIEFEDDRGEILKFECPRLSVACVEMFCPANCAGRGKCNYNRKFPTCECYDKGDMTDGCYDTIIQAPEINYDDNSCRGASSSATSSRWRPRSMMMMMMWCFIVVVMVVFLSY